MYIAPLSSRSQNMKIGVHALVEEDFLNFGRWLGQVMLLSKKWITTEFWKGQMCACIMYLLLNVKKQITDLADLCNRCPQEILAV